MATTWRCNTKTGIMNTYTLNARAMTVSMATIWTPSMHACRAQKESPSTSNTREPEPTESERTFQHTTQDEGTANRIHCRTNNALNTETEFPTARHGAHIFADENVTLHVALVTCGRVARLTLVRRSSGKQTLCCPPLNSGQMSVLLLRKSWVSNVRAPEPRRAEAQSNILACVCRLARIVFGTLTLAAFPNFRPNE